MERMISYEPMQNPAGNRYYIARNPEKPQMLMLHGWQDSSETFRFIETDLYRHFELVRMDWKGHGSSPSQPKGELYHTGLLFQQLAAMTHILKKPYHILAHSMGAAASARFAGAFPEEVQSLVLLEGFSGVQSFEKEADRFTDWLKRTRQSFDSQQKRSIMKSRSIAKSYLSRMHSKLSEEQIDQMTDWLTESVQEGSQSLTWRHDQSMRNRSAAIPFPPELSRVLWSRIACPVLLFMGEKSPLKPDQHKLEEILSHFQNLNYIELPDCGHNMHHEIPEKVLDYAFEFFRKNGFLSEPF